MKKRLRKPSPAMIIACVALFLATTGTGVAVINALPKGSVGTKQLKNGAVGTKQLKNNAVISSKVKNHSLKAVDFAAGQLPKGAKGATGAAGTAGAAGAAGAAGVSKFVKRTAEGTFGTNFSKVTASCNTGEVATGGGADWDASTSTGWPVVSYSVPDPYNAAIPTGWAVEIDNISGSGGVQAIAWVFCAAP
jgi:hypothetical protein